MYEKRSNVGKWLRRGAAGVLSLILLFSLIQPGLAGAEQNYICGKEAHTHGEGCYETKTETVTTKVLKCSLDVPAPAAEDGETGPGYGHAHYVHAHNDDCYEGEALVCPLEEIEEHTHEASCYGTEYQCGQEEAEVHQHSDACQKELICTETAEDHQHGEECWQPKECLLEETGGHAHSAACGYNLICEKPVVVLHSHEETCYAPMTVAEGEEEQEPKLTCTTPVVEKHEHGKDCWEEKTEEKEVKTLICGKEEHEHTDACVEKAEEKEEEKKPAYTCGKDEHTHSEGCYDEADALICELEEHTHEDACKVQEPETCEHCGVELVEGAVHAEDCLSLCICEEDFEIHEAKCPFADGEKAFAYYEEKLKELQKESETIADGLDKTAADYADKLKALLDDYTERLMECYGDSYYYYEEDVFTSEQDEELLAIVEGVLEYLQTEYGYDYQTGILNVERTYVDTATYHANKNYSVLQPATNPDITINLFDYASATGVGDLPYDIGGHGANYFDKTGHSGTLKGTTPTTNLLVDGYPALTNLTDGGAPVSARHFYDKELEPATALPKDLDSTRKSVERYPVESGSLFTRQNGYYVFDSKNSHAVYSFEEGVGTVKVYDYAVAPFGTDVRYRQMGHFLPFNGNVAGDATYTGTYYPIQLPSGGNFNFQAVGQATAEQMAEIYTSKSYVKHGWPFAQKPYQTQKDLYSLKPITAQYAYCTGTNYGNEGTTPYWNFTYTDVVNYKCSTCNQNKYVYCPQCETNSTGTVCATCDAITCSHTEADGAIYPVKLHDGLGEDKADYAVNMWIGLTVDFDFVQPQNGKVNNADMIYEFSGDDLLWVYIDGVKILDVAQNGVTGYAGGAKWATINFATGEVIVYTVDASRADISNGNALKDNVESLTWDGTRIDQSAKGTYKYVAYKTTIKECFTNAGKYDASKFDGDTFKDYTTHEFDLFYQDSGHGTSNCYMRFNIKTISPSKASLTKEVSGINEAIADNQTYNFIVTAKESGADKLFTSLSYYIMEKGEQLANSEKTLSSTDGSFTVPLKAGQTAMFTNVSEDTVMTFAEQAVDSGIAETPIWKKGSEDYTPGSEVRLDSTGVSVTCTNPRKTESLTVEKAFEGKQLAENDQFPIKVTFGTTPYSGKAKVTGKSNTLTGTAESEIEFKDGVAMLKVGEKLTITGIPTGYTYTVVEQNPNAVTGNSNYSYLFDNDDGTKEGYPKYTFTDEVKDGKRVISAESAVKITNKHSVADLEIRKVMASATEKPIYDSFKVNVTINSNRLKVTSPAATISYRHWDATNKQYVDGSATVTENGKVTIEGIAVTPDKPATIKRIPYDATYTIEETSGYGYDASYTYSLIQDNKATVDTNAEVSTGTVTNTKKTTADEPNPTPIVINVTKNLNNPDKKNHTFAFRLVQVDATGEILYKQENTPLYQEDISITMNDEQATGSFHALVYETADLKNGTELKENNEVIGIQKKFYYKVMEITEDSRAYDTDQSVFTVEVTLTGKQNELSATSIIKQGNDVKDKIEFNNTILGTLTVKKSIYGGDANDNFKFQLKTADWVNGEYDYEKKSGNGQLTFVNGVAEFHLRDGESLTLYGLPHGLEVQVHEVGTDKYAEFYKVNSSITREGQTVKVDVESKGTTVKYINYEVTSSWLPQTGQLKWPVLVLAALGIGFMGFGFLTRKRKKNGK